LRVAAAPVYFPFAVRANPGANLQGWSPENKIHWNKKDVDLKPELL
jgi:hypothetical protein